jgi:hypothetical protein
MMRLGRSNPQEGIKMLKKFSLLLAAVAVLAFAVPAMASASAVTTQAGALIGTPTTVEGTGTNVILTSSTLGSISCGTLNLVGTLTKNDGSTVEGSASEQEPVTSDCTNTHGTVTVTKLTLTKLFAGTVGGVQKQFVNFTSKVDIGALTCNITGTEVPFTYTAGDDKIVFTEATGATAAGCGTLKLDGSFTIEVGGAGVKLDGPV